MRSLDSYLKRVGLVDSIGSISQDQRNTLEILKTVILAQSKTIAFENIDVVQRKRISMEPLDVETKLVDQGRGGYCFELNTLLKIVLEELGFAVVPLLCRIRWGKPNDDLEPSTTYTHLALKVTTCEGKTYLVDVGFAGSNSVEPIPMDSLGVSYKLSDGEFQIVPSKHEGYVSLQLLDTKEPQQWHSLYEWKDECAPFIDQECSNWFSCTHPTARFTNEFFAARLGDDLSRHRLLNETYIVRKGHGASKEVTKEIITTKERLEDLITNVFGIQLSDTTNIDRFLTVEEEQ